jgi:DNA helicase-2/ATP-dependent DNA helicase PcrA
VVGDEDQSIYGWRGANIRNILDFERDFPGAIIIRLEQNYRSTKNILEAASAVVANNTERIGKWLWTESGEGEKITLYEAPDAENEALFIADTIEKMLRAAIRGARRGAVPDQFAVAADRRSAAALQPQVQRGRRIQLLSARRGEGHSGVSEGPAIAAGFGRPAAHHQHSGARHRPHDGGADRAQFARSTELSLWGARQMLEEHAFRRPRRSRLSAFHRMMRSWRRRSKSRPAADTLGDVLERTGYRKMLEEEGTEEARRAWRIWMNC